MFSLGVVILLNIRDRAYFGCGCGRVKRDLTIAKSFFWGGRQVRVLMGRLQERQQIVYKDKTP